MTLHDQLLGTLQSVAHVALVSSLRDERLDFAAADDIRVFIPDLHLLSDAAESRYPYGTNDRALLSRVVRAIAALKRSTSAAFGVYQAGDFFDLWRETPVRSDRLDAASRIIDSRRDVVPDLLSPDLALRCVYGNHDVDLHRMANFPAWQRRYYLAPRGSTNPTALLIHGDLFEWRRFIPDPVQNLFVYLLAPLYDATENDIGQIADIIEEENSRQDFSRAIAGEVHLAAFRSLDGGIPARFNVGTPAQGKHEFLDRAASTAACANAAYGLGLRCVVIGHTHRARICVDDNHPDLGFFCLVDTGAWIERCVTPQGVFPNAQITVLSQNEVRIYQLS